MKKTEHFVSEFAPVFSIGLYKPANEFFLPSLSYVRARTRFDMTCSEFGQTKKIRE